MHVCACHFPPRLYHKTTTTKQTKTREIDAACCLCPAYDIEKAFKHFEKRHPYVDSYLLGEVKQKLVITNETLLRNHNSKAVDACLNAKSVDDILHAHVCSFFVLFFVYVQCPSHKSSTFSHTHIYRYHLPEHNRRMITSNDRIP